MLIDYNFLKTMGISITDGRDFSEEFGTDLTQSVILNETAVKQLGITDPIGRMVGGKTIIGVVKDFNLHSIHSNISPLMISMADNDIHKIAIHYKPGTLNSILPMIEEEWKKAAPDQPIHYTKIEDRINDLYSSESDLETIVFIFTFFTLLISALGLFGLTLFVARSRKREIGIKKVFGCSERSIVYSFLLNNFILILIAALLSVPLNNPFYDKWVDNFAFKTGINLGIFVISFTVCYHSCTFNCFYIHSYKAVPCKSY